MQQPVVLVLASGRGERFAASGGHGPKLRALLAGKPVLEHTLDAVRASGLPWHLEDAGHAGMGDSIAAAVHATRDAGGWLVLPGDLPLVQPASLQRIAAAMAEQGVVVPTWQGERGHPVGFAAGCRAALLALRGGYGAAAIMRAEAAAGRLLELALADAGIRTDIDTLDDLAAAERLLALR
ncbi:MAG: molybdopterin-guanine dinucleotide biosynthesis protein MobA [Ramlibacter sp.]|jgi:molybdenum cofactor cytidylyltransferase|uniref:nucleotidyltransferase family protein n=1 Tax=Ramlibacter sp. TaxID=1917967 RepID=UPI0026116C84|nr:NTP transferase domain-containing protein [Ramlibacter sp.]MDB5750344.1 molybdopterin-guanine dinucleotide biosynthesis protein MobA [Ramlibacter sp.]